MHLLSDLMKGKYVALKRTDEDVSKSGRDCWELAVIHLLLSRVVEWMNSHNSIILLWQQCRVNQWSVYWFSCNRTKMATVLRRWLSLTSLFSQKYGYIRDEVLTRYVHNTHLNTCQSMTHMTGQTLTRAGVSSGQSDGLTFSLPCDIKIGHSEPIT